MVAADGQNRTGIEDNKQNLFYVVYGISVMNAQMF